MSNEVAPADYSSWAVGWTGFAGVMLIIFRPFTKGDYVEVAGVAGRAIDGLFQKSRIRYTGNLNRVLKGQKDPFGCSLFGFQG